MWVCADSLGTALFICKRGIGLLNVGYGLSIHNKDSHTQGQLHMETCSYSLLGEKYFKSAAITIAPKIAFSSDRLSYYAKKLRLTTSKKRDNLKTAALSNKELKIPVINVELEGN